MWQTIKQWCAPTNVNDDEDDYAKLLELDLYGEDSSARARDHVVYHTQTSTHHEQ